VCTYLTTPKERITQGRTGEELAPLKSLTYHAQRDTANATCVLGTPLPPVRPSRCESREGRQKPKRPPPTGTDRGLAAGIPR